MTAFTVTFFFSLQHIFSQLPSSYKIWLPSFHYFFGNSVCPSFFSIFYFWFFHEWPSQYLCYMAHQTYKYKTQIYHRTKVPTWTSRGGAKIIAFSTILLDISFIVNCGLLSLSSMTVMISWVVLAKFPLSLALTDKVYVSCFSLSSFSVVNTSPVELLIQNLKMMKVYYKMRGIK